MRTVIPTIDSKGLRDDLIAVADTRAPRRVTLIDAISGRISRLSHKDWNRLQKDNRNFDDRDPLLAQASAAGLLRDRPASRPQTIWASPLHLLAIRIPLFSIDKIAERVAKRASFLFAPMAIVTWSAIIMIAGVSVLFGLERATNSLHLLYAESNSASSLALSLSAMFIAMKCVHELAHAVACRRLQVRAGEVGLFIFCGVPCPYCDVSQIWRVDSRLQRAAVMMAGVYVELITASIATLLWWLTTGGPLHLLAINTMLVCGISAILFNANPLMKLDGYYVLSDALGTPNLRRMSAQIWNSLVMARIAGSSSRQAAITTRSISLATYHLASTFYRWMLCGMIAFFIFAVLEEWNLYWLGILILFVVSLTILFRFFHANLLILRGEGMWISSHWLRRIAYVASVFAIITGTLFLPVRRDLPAAGWIDVADSVTLFVPAASWVESVGYEFGDQVNDGDVVASFRDEDLNVQLATYKTRSSIAALESEHLKRKVLRSGASDMPWAIDQASSDLIRSQYTLLTERLDRLEVRATASGVVLPLLSFDQNRHQASTQDEATQSLRKRIGRYESGQVPWCRIGDPQKMVVRLPVSAKTRQAVSINDPVKLIVDQTIVRAIPSEVIRIDEIPLSEGPTHDARFIIQCALPAQTARLNEFGPIGKPVEAMICIETEPVWKWLQRTISEFVSGSTSPRVAL